MVLCMCVCVCVCVRVRVCVYMSVCTCVCLSVHRCGPSLYSCGVCDPCMFGGVPFPLLPHLCVQEVQGFQSTAQVEQLLLEHGERVVDRLGTEIDRVEIKIKVGVGQFQTATPTLSTHACTSLQKHSPDVRHVDLEII